jgi:hypothetical protein
MAVNPEPETMKQTYKLLAVITACVVLVAGPARSGMKVTGYLLVNETNVIDEISSSTNGIIEAAANK